VLCFKPSASSAKISRKKFEELLVFLPFVLSFDRQKHLPVDLMTNVGIYALLAMGRTCRGFTGLLNLGYAAFFAIGAYTYALLNLHAGWLFWPACRWRGLVSMLFGF